MKKLLSVLLALVLVFSLALPAFARGDADMRDENFGIAKGYVRTKETQKDAEGSVHSIARAYNKQGKIVKEVETYKGDGYSGSTTTKWTYDKKGNMTKWVLYDTNSVNTTVYTYNAKNKLTKESRKIVYEDNSVWTSTRTYAYDKAGRPVKELAYYDDCTEVRTYAYNSKGKPTKETETQSYEDNTKTVVTTTYTYDKNGNETKMAYVNKDRYGSVEKRTMVSTYNAKNLCVKVVEDWSFTNNKKKTDTSRDVTTYTYDKKGNIVKEAFQSSSSDGYKRTLNFANTYDAKGNRIKQVCTEKTTNYTAKTTSTSTYDKKGNLLKEVRVMKDNKSVEKATESFTYDKAGNLVKYAYNDGSNKNVTVYTYQKIGA